MPAITNTTSTATSNAAAQQLLDSPPNLTLGLSAFRTSTATLDKLREYPQILGPHIQITGKRYSLIELNAGCGFNIDRESGEYHLGTPVLATALLEQIPEVQSEVIAVDYDAEAIRLLNQTLTDRPTTMRTVLIKGDNSHPAVIDSVASNLTHTNGLIMFDPYGAALSTTVTTYAGICPNFDLLIRLNASQCWRNAGAARASAWGHQSDCEAAPTDAFVPPRPTAGHTREDPGALGLTGRGLRHHSRCKAG